MQKSLKQILCGAIFAGLSLALSQTISAQEEESEETATEEEEVTDPQELYLIENAKKEDVIVRPSGLQIRIIKKGDGDIPARDSELTAHYHGTLVDGTVFDTTRDSNPLTFRMDDIIKGWRETMSLMREGAIYEVVIPADIGYGEAGAAGGRIPPNATLIFEVELIDVTNPVDLSK